MSRFTYNLWQLMVRSIRSKAWYFAIYKCYWHLLIYGEKTQLHHRNYYSAIPNSRAGIGHQMGNWIAGYWYARHFNLNFAHDPFSNNKWEEFLGFGENEIKLNDLVMLEGYKKVLLPLFNNRKNYERILIQKIISSYSNKKVVFIAEQDQFYFEQYTVIEDIRRKFYNSNSRGLNKLIYSDQAFNIAIHIRRGDINVKQKNKVANLQLRWQDECYFRNVLNLVLQELRSDKLINIYIFSQGNVEDFKEFEGIENIKFCLDMGPQDSFLHMVYADLLITSKSSFSYKPALLNRGVKISPADFWHGYPNDPTWLLASEEGKFNTQTLGRLR